MAVAGHSDVDRGGVYAADPLYLLGLGRTKPEEPTYVQKTPQPDMWLHEAKKMLRLQLNGNPTSSEILWLDNYEIKTNWGQSLIDIRNTMLSAERIRYGYLGFASAQLHRFFGYDKTTTEGRKHSAKNARHLWRLLHQGLKAYAGDGITVRLSSKDAEACREFGEEAVQYPERVESLLRSAENKFSEIKTPLPRFPDNTAAVAWLNALRRFMFENNGEIVV